MSKLSEETAIYLGSLDSDEGKFLIQASSPMVYAPPGYLLFVRDRTLLAQPFDRSQLEVSGESLPVAEQVGTLGEFSVSDSGILVYHSGVGPTTRRLVWRDRSGKLLGTVGEPGSYIQIDLSPDQSRVAVVRLEDSSGTDIWLLELSTGILSRFTFDPSHDGNPTWSPDGRRLTFDSERNGPANLFQKSVGGSKAELLFESEDSNYPMAWSKDADILFLSQKPKGRALYALHLGKEGEGEPKVLLEDSFTIGDFRLSPNEKWVAYRSDESGRLEVYTAAFPDFSNRRQVSRDGGAHVRWRGDGKELFFLQLDGKLMSVEVKEGAILELETGTPKVLFEANALLANNRKYCVTSDGQRFLFIERVGKNVEPIHVVLNWHEELKRLVPTDN